MLLYVDANFASPYALAVYVSLLEKGLTFETEAVDLVARAHRGPAFAETSITQRVPTLVHDGFALSESSAICEYIDETFAGARPYLRTPVTPPRNYSLPHSLCSMGAPTTYLATGQSPMSTSR